MDNSTGQWRRGRSKREERQIKSQNCNLPFNGSLSEFLPLAGLLLPLWSPPRNRVLSLGMVYRDLNLFFSFPNLITLYYNKDDTLAVDHFPESGAYARERTWGQRPHLGALPGEDMLCGLASCFILLASISSFATSA